MKSASSRKYGKETTTLFPMTSNKAWNLCFHTEIKYFDMVDLFGNNVKIDIKFEELLEEKKFVFL